MSEERNEEHPSSLHAGTVREETFLAVLADVARRLEADRVPHAFMGGIASTALGRERLTRDIDIFVGREDASRGLDTLSAGGYETERTNPNWLYKATRLGVLVDIIFQSKPDWEFDSEMRRRARRLPFKGLQLTVLSAEDLLLIKLGAFAEHVPRHWFDCLALVAGGELDWEYLLRRVRRPHRLLSLLGFARDEGIEVPDAVLAELAGTAQGSQGLEAHVLAHLHEHLAAEGAGELKVEARKGLVVVSGTVPTRQRAESIAAGINRLLSAGAWDNRIEVADFAQPAETEKLP